MSTHKRTAVISVLVVLLIAAAINTFLIFHASVKQPAALLSQNNDTPGAGLADSAASGALPSGRKPFLGWYGDVSLAKSGKGKYDVIVTAGQQGKPIDVDYVEADLSKGEGATAGLTPKFTHLPDGTYKASVEFPSSGDWEVRVRLHRLSETLQFSRRFQVEAGKKATNKAVPG